MNQAQEAIDESAHLRRKDADSMKQIATLGHDLSVCNQSLRDTKQLLRDTELKVNQLHQ